MKFILKLNLVTLGVIGLIHLLTELMSSGLKVDLIWVIYLYLVPILFLVLDLKNKLLIPCEYKRILLVFYIISVFYGTYGTYSVNILLFLFMLFVYAFSPIYLIFKDCDQIKK